jgi:hypothetical protein
MLFRRVFSFAMSFCRSVPWAHISPCAVVRYTVSFCFAVGWTSTSTHGKRWAHGKGRFSGSDSRIKKYIFFLINIFSPAQKISVHKVKKYIHGF